MAPQAITQVFFMLVYAVWWTLAWPGWGTLAFGLAILYALVVSVLSIRNVRHSRQFEIVATNEGQRIGKQMGILSGVSYGLVWIAILALAILGHPRWILPTVATIIALHFLPMARIFNRKIDYLIAPIAILFALLGLWLAANSGVTWQTVYAITGVGGALATGTYASYLLRAYRELRASDPRASST